MSRNLICVVTFMAVLGLFGVAADAQNQIRNWEFDEPLDTTGATGHWWMWETQNFTGLSVVEGAGLSGRNALKVDINEGAPSPLQVIQSFLTLEQGTTYVISFMAKADAPRTVTVLLQGRTLYNWQVFWMQADIELTTEPQTFTFEYTHGRHGGWNGRLQFRHRLVFRPWRRRHRCLLRQNLAGDGASAVTEPYDRPRSKAGRWGHGCVGWHVPELDAGGVRPYT